MEKLIETSANVLGVPLTAVIVTAIGMVAVYFIIQSKRKKSRDEIDNSYAEMQKEIALLKLRIAASEKRLDDGNEKFNSMDATLRNINSSIERLTGMVEMFFRSQGLGGSK